MCILMLKQLMYNVHTLYASDYYSMYTCMHACMHAYRVLTCEFPYLLMRIDLNSDICSFSVVLCQVTVNGTINVHKYGGTQCHVYYTYFNPFASAQCCSQQAHKAIEIELCNAQQHISL